MPDHLIMHDGEAYISIGTMFHIMEAVIATRDEVIKSKPELAPIIPGSDVAIDLLGNVLSNARYSFVESADLAKQADGTIKDIYEFLKDE